MCTVDPENVHKASTRAFLDPFNRDKDEFLSHTITDDKIWILYVNAKTKQNLTVTENLIVTLSKTPSDETSCIRFEEGCVTIAKVFETTW